MKKKTAEDKQKLQVAKKQLKQKRFSTPIKNHNLQLNLSNIHQLLHLHAKEAFLSSYQFTAPLHLASKQKTVDSTEQLHYILLHLILIFLWKVIHVHILTSPLDRVQSVVMQIIFPSATDLKLQIFLPLLIPVSLWDRGCLFRKALALLFL